MITQYPQIANTNFNLCVTTRRPRGVAFYALSNTGKLLTLTYRITTRGDDVQSHIYRCLTFLFICELVCVIGCRRAPFHDEMKIDAPHASKLAMIQFDANGDGKLDKNELNKSPGLQAAISQLDPDKCGYVTAIAITKRIRQWQATHLGRIPIACIVTFNDKPLVGARVEFEPAMFLYNNNNLTAIGATDNNGMAVMNIPNNPSWATGVALGFYSVKITHAKVEIPINYNRETHLGIEIAPDSDGIQERHIDGKELKCVEFHLKTKSDK